MSERLDEKDMTSGDEGRDEPFIEFVHSLQVHVAGLPHVLIHQIKSGMSDELVQMSVIILSASASSRGLVIDIIIIIILHFI